MLGGGGNPMLNTAIEWLNMVFQVDAIVAAIIAMGEAIRFREKESEIYIGSW